MSFDEQHFDEHHHCRERISALSKKGQMLEIERRRLYKAVEYLKCCIKSGEREGVIDKADRIIEGQR